MRDSRKSGHGPHGMGGGEPNTTALPIGSPYTLPYTNPFEHIRYGQTYSCSDNMMDLFPDGSQRRP